MERVRPAALAGTWYPGRASELSALVESFLEDAQPDALAELAAAVAAAGPPAAGPSTAGAPVSGAPVARAPGAGRPLLTVVPHAGYAYSGATAGRAYRRLAAWDYDRVFILAPSHRTRLRAVSVPGYAAYETPLGQVALDRDAAAALARAEGFTSVDAAHAAEHAEEIQLPFLQALYGARLRIVPLLVPPLPDAARAAAAAALAPFCDGRSLFVISSDFTHYGAAYGYLPFRDRVPARLAELDGGAAERILARDPQGLLAYEARTGITMCGLEAAALALSAPLPALDGELVAYARSGDRDGDYSLSVSYVGLLLSQRAAARAPADAAAEAAPRAGAPPAPTPGPTPAPTPSPQVTSAPAPAAAPAPAGLTAAERGLLLALARAVVEATARREPPPSPEAVASRLGAEISPALRQKRGAFVTLTSGGQLRGCIGYIEGIKSLAAAVADNAAAATCHDPRFFPLREDELPQVRIEISALTPLRAVEGPEAIEIGRHGIVLAKGRARSVFLPQVAPEQGWDLEMTLDHLAMKAGLPAESWRVGARFQVFEADVFSEEGAHSR